MTSLRVVSRQTSRSAASTGWITGLVCVVLGSAIFLAWGIALQHQSPNRLIDFRTIYFNARVLLDHKDPYNAVNGEQLAMQLGEKPIRSDIPLPSEITCVYPPSALLVSIPLGILPRIPAQLLWTLLISTGFILSGFLMWEVAADSAPILAGLLIGFLLANSAGLIYQGNAAGVAVSLCAIAAWCFFRDRFVLLGVAFMAVSLAIKPHDAGLVWLYLLLTPKHRKNALYVALVAAVILAAGVIWVAQVAPGWSGELKANIAAVSAKGTGNDPGPSSGSNTAANSDVNLQAIFAVVKDDPDFYNRTSYLICASLLILGAIHAFRFPVNALRFWLALGFMAALAMLPVYHRHHDAKLLILAVPACAALWSRDRRLGLVGLAILSLAIAATADVPRAILTLALRSTSLSVTTASGKLTIILLTRPAPVFILLTAVFFLIALWTRAGHETLPESTGRSV